MHSGKRENFIQGRRPLFLSIFGRTRFSSRPASTPMPSVPTGGTSAADAAAAATSSRPLSAARPSRAALVGKSKRTPFLSTTERKLRLELMGEETPGPGSYMPASTFGKHAKQSDRQFAGRPSSSFRSETPQRARAINQHVPGAGAYTPNQVRATRMISCA